MSRRNVIEVREVPPDIGRCDFKGGWICERPGTTYIEWDIDGVRDRGVYCDEHAALEEQAEPSPEKPAHAEYEALTDADRSVLEAASGALERRAGGLRAMSAAVPAGTTFDHAGEAEEAVAHVEMLRTLDATEPLDQRRIDALQAGRQALHAEVDGWRNLAEVATTADWRAEFDARAEEAERLWRGAGELQRQLEERDRGIEQECER